MTDATQPQGPDSPLEPIPEMPATEDKLDIISWTGEVLAIAERNAKKAIASAMADSSYGTEDIHARSPYSRGKNNTIARELGVPPRKRGGNR